MSLSPTITPAILDTVLAHLAPHFLAGANGDLPTARHAAGRMLAAYNAETPEELRLATEIVSFSFHALEALSEAAAPGLSLTRVLRLRGSAVSLSRESRKAQRKLDQLQRARLTQSLQPEATVPQQEATPSLSPAVPDEPAAAPDKPPVQARKLSRQERRAAQRMVENLKRQQAEQRRREALTMPVRAETVNHLGV